YIYIYIYRLTRAAGPHTEPRSKLPVSWVSIIFTLFLLFILVIFVFYRLCTRKMRQLCGYTLADYRPTSTDPTDNLIATTSKTSGNMEYSMKKFVEAYI
uniref:DAG1 domain-containing protein n=1 Tax=Ascaris lumbricoides TaxID=6252 RepID=A0A0M3ICV9_ASCLU